jgi:hypothetical protein
MKARTAYVVAKSTLEARLREQMHDELANLQTQVDIAVRYAYDTGESKAAILRAMGTKFYGTLNDSLDRTHGVSEVIGDDPFDGVYAYDPETSTLEVTYVNHGPQDISGKARFNFREFVDGKKLFLSEDKLWNEDYTVRNDVVALLDQKDDGFYYEEAIQWLSTKKH